MEKEQFKQYLQEYIKLIALYLNNKEDPSFEVDKDRISFFYRLSKYHSLKALLYQVLKTTKVNIKEDYLNKLEQDYLFNVRKSLAFEEERKALYQYLNEQEIDYLPLKGIVIREYYPDPNTREFADNDILFGSGDKKIRDFFVKRGYKSEYFRKSNHDVYLKKPLFNFEMHRSLFGETGDNEVIVKYFDNYLSKAIVKENREHYLSKEDFYIYFTAHSYKHFHQSGCGIRTLVDYYVYLKKEQLDFNYINQELEKIGLLEFSNKISSLSIKLFDQTELSEEEEEMLLFIASSGTYGTLEHSVEKGVEEKGRFGYFMARVFPPYRFYKSAFPWAYKVPILIPIAWMMRCFRVIFKNPKKAASEIKLIGQQKNDNNKE